MIACQNDDMAIGARRVFEELGSVRDRNAWLRLPITGCDGIPRSGQEWVRQGRLAATVVSPPLMGMPWSCWPQRSTPARNHRNARRFLLALFRL
jgi:ABC-type sugar transport system substrate-binding protein